MGLFNRKQSTSRPLGDELIDGYRAGYEPTLDEATERMKETAIEYIVNLGKADKDKFFEGVELIWQGYQNIDNVKTKHQKALQREAKANGLTVDEADDLGFDLLEDELPSSNPLINDKPSTGKTVDGVKVGK